MHNWTLIRYPRSINITFRVCLKEMLHVPFSFRQLFSFFFSHLMQARQLIGSTILVKEGDRPELEEGEFYTPDLYGMKVILKVTICSFLCLNAFPIAELRERG